MGIWFFYFLKKILQRIQSNNQNKLLLLNSNMAFPYSTLHSMIYLQILRKLLLDKFFTLLAVKDE